MNQFSLDSVRWRFGHKQVLSNLFLLGAKGEIIGILGRNGCGKSTLFKWIFADLRGEEGMVQVDGQFCKPSERWRYFAYLPQSGFLPRDLSVRRAVQVFLNKPRAATVLANERIAGLLHRPIRALSGGEQRFLELLCVLALQKPFVLLDEPFAEIEPRYVEMIIDVLRQKTKDSCIVITDHAHVAVRSICTRLMVMARGVLFECPNNAEALVQFGYYPNVE